MGDQLKGMLWNAIRKYIYIGIGILMGCALIGCAVIDVIGAHSDGGSSSSGNSNFGASSTQLEGMDLYNADGSVNEEAINSLQKYIEKEYLGGISGEFKDNRSYAQASRNYAQWWDDSTYNGMEKFQCTWWARGRANQYLEAIGKEKISGATGNGCEVRANLAERGFSIGTEPRPNSLITWGASSDNSYGHIAYVEAVDKDGTIYFSEAGSGKSWYGITKLEKGSYDYAGMPFQGFVYLSDEEFVINNRKCK